MTFWEQLLEIINYVALIDYIREEVPRLNLFDDSMNRVFNKFNEGEGSIEFDHSSADHVELMTTKTYDKEVWTGNRRKSEWEDLKGC